MNSPNKSLAKSAWVRDLALCRRMAISMIQEIQQDMEEGLPDDEPAYKQRKRRAEWMYGSRESLSSVLVIMTTLLLKLHEFDRKQAEAIDMGFPATDSSPLSDEDMAILNRYVERTTAA